MILLKVITVRNVFSATSGFLIIRFKFQNSICNGCHDLTMLCLNISNIAIITVKGVGYCIIVFIRGYIRNVFQRNQQ